MTHGAKQECDDKVVTFELFIIAKLIYIKKHEKILHCFVVL